MQHVEQVEDHRYMVVVRTILGADHRPERNAGAVRVDVEHAVWSATLIALAEPGAWLLDDELIALHRVRADIICPPVAFEKPKKDPRRCGRPDRRSPAGPRHLHPAAGPAER